MGYFWSLKDLNGMGLMKEGERKKKGNEKMSSVDTKQLVNSVILSLLNYGLVRSLILSQMTPLGLINSLLYLLKMYHQGDHF